MDEERPEAEISCSVSGNMTVSLQMNLTSDLPFSCYLLALATQFVYSAFLPSLGVKPNATCKPHTANIFISKLISGPGAYFSDSYGEPQCVRVKTQSFSLKSLQLLFHLFLSKQ